MSGFFALSMRAAVWLVCWSVSALWYPLSWLLERYPKRLKHQILAEGDLSTQKPFLETGKSPRRGFAPSRLTMIALLLSVVAVSIGIFMVLCEAIVRGFGLQDAELTGTAADVVFFALLVVYYSVFVALNEITRRYMLEGRFFSTYAHLMTHVRALKSSAEVLAYAPTLRLCAKRHIRGPYDLYRVMSAWRAQEDHSAYYRSERLIELLTLLEQRYPFVSKDEDLRQRYWDFGRALYRVLWQRNPDWVEGSLFSGLPPHRGGESETRFNGVSHTAAGCDLRLENEGSERVLN